MTLNEKLIYLKESNQLLQKEIANGIGVSLRSYQRYEYGEREPSVSVLIAIADFFNVSIDYLVGRDNIDHTKVELQHHLILPEKKEKLLKIFDTLDTHNQGALLERAEMLLETQEENNMAQKDALTPQKGA